MHPGQSISIYDVADLIREAISHALTPVNIQKGFEIAGLYPFNEDIFQEQVFNQLRNRSTINRKILFQCRFSMFFHSIKEILCW